MSNETVDVDALREAMRVIYDEGVPETSALLLLVEAAIDEIEERRTVETPQQSSKQQLRLGDGKYLFRKDDRGNLHCDRYGEPWRDFIGDHAVTLLFEAALHLPPDETPARSPCEVPGCDGLAMVCLKHLSAKAIARARRRAELKASEGPDKVYCSTCGQEDRDCYCDPSVYTPPEKTSDTGNPVSEQKQTLSPSADVSCEHDWSANRKGFHECLKGCGYVMNALTAAVGPDPRNEQ